MSKYLSKREQMILDASLDAVLRESEAKASGKQLIVPDLLSNKPVPTSTGSGSKKSLSAIDLNVNPVTKHFGLRLEFKDKD